MNLECIEVKKIYLKNTQRMIVITFFGKAPKTVYENLLNIEKNDCSILTQNSVFTTDIINSFKTSSLDQYMMEIEHRLLPKYKKELNNLIKNIEINSKLISLNYLILNEIYFNLFIDSLDHISLSSKIKTISKIATTK